MELCALNVIMSFDLFRFDHIPMEIINRPCGTAAPQGGSPSLPNEDVMRCDDGAVMRECQVQEGTGRMVQE